MEMLPKHGEELLMGSSAAKEWMSENARQEQEIQ
jgi:hypothetical protein